MPSVNFQQPLVGAPGHTNPAAKHKSKIAAVLAARKLVETGTKPKNFGFELAAVAPLPKSKSKSASASAPKPKLRPKTVVSASAHVSKNQQPARASTQASAPTKPAAAAAAHHESFKGFIHKHLTVLLIVLGAIVVVGGLGAAFAFRKHAQRRWPSGGFNSGNDSLYGGYHAAGDADDADDTDDADDDDGW